MAKLVPEFHPALHAIAKEVPREKIASPRIQKVLKDMRAILHAYKDDDFTGVAIAAPQIGIPLRIFLIEDTGRTNTNKDEKDTPRIPTLVAINPRLTKLSKKKKLAHEGCLSVHNCYGMVRRSIRATIRAYDEHGVAYERGASGLLAQVFQHEVDHLDGTLFLDRAEEIIAREMDRKESEPQRIKTL